ncbi:MAG: T9SS type A sorting domain-containing protein [Bacteroidales bacterium]|jgi:hypothetical protein|nr:T9SS type A sorting domain-containing protein [Bacteroidales bacterium]
MKKIIYLFLPLVFTITYSFGQTQIPNGSFENWTGEELDGWTSTAEIDLGFFPISISLLSSSDDAHDGDKAVRLDNSEVASFTVPGVLTLGNVDVDISSFSPKLDGGIPFQDRPKALTGWFKYLPQGPDSLLIYCILTKENAVSGVDTIGDVSLVYTGTHSDYTMFTAEINYLSDDNPDLMNIIIASAGYTGTADTYALIDDLKFAYETSINEAEVQNMYIYPNPSTGVFRASFEKAENRTIRVFDISGRKVFEENTNEMYYSIDLNGVVKGMYILEIDNGTSKETRKLIKE